ncbi:MAG: 16S rRNA (adenine(1518)-N(6)/adenine(1519)-N(6))-dimethyltransferase RsmA [Pseudomonadota bacterium]
MVEDGLPPLRAVIAAQGLKARKALGQNFLLDLNLTAKIARAAGPLGDTTVYEVGPGPGGLTRALLAAGARRVVAVEKDPRCRAALADIAAAYPGRLDVVEGDALRCDETALCGPGPVKIVANLPYNIGTALLVKWLSAEPWPPFWASLTVMLQKEVAERLAAPPGGKAYGRLSVLAQWRARPRRLFDVPPRAFTPPPKVTSTLIEVLPAEPCLDVALADLEAVSAAAFAQRRKMLRAALRALTPAAEGLLQAADIVPTARAEQLDVMDFARLAQAWAALRRSGA